MHMSLARMRNASLAFGSILLIVAFAALTTKATGLVTTSPNGTKILIAGALAFVVTGGFGLFVAGQFHTLASHSKPAKPRWNSNQRGKHVLE